MSSQGSRIYNYYSATVGLGPLFFPAYLRGEIKPPRDVLNFYYRLDISPSNTNTNQSVTDFVTDPSGTGIYRGIANRYMVNNDFITYNSNILSFIGYRTPKNIAIPSNIRVPDMYNETISINVTPYNDNFIQATANYIDEGTGFTTTIPFVDYNVSTASGIFSGYKKLRINFYNNGNPPGFTGLGPVRIIEIYK